MLFFNYIILILKQLIRIKIAFFFTLIFPMLLYLFYARNHESATLVAFFNFAMQSAMLQTVGIYTSIQKNSTWGEFVSSLPAPSIYPILTTIIAMFLIGIISIGMIGLIDFFVFHTLPFSQLLLALTAAALGSLPMGALGYLVGTILDPLSTRNCLVLINLIFLFITFVPQKLNHILSFFCLPNSWLYFSLNLVTGKHLDITSLSVLVIYFVIFLGIITQFNKPKMNYT